MGSVFSAMRWWRTGLLLEMLCLVVGESRFARAVPLNPGDIVIADSQGIGAPGMIVRVDRRTGEQAIVAQGENLIQPLGVVADSNGDLLVSDRGLPGRIIRVDGVTGAQTVVSEGQFFGSPYAIAIAPDGQVLVTEVGTSQERRNRIIRVDPSTGIQTLVTPPSSVAGAFVDLQTITVAATGDIFVVDRGVDGVPDGRVIRVDPASGEQTVVAQGDGSLSAPLEDPFGITADRNGKLLVTDPDVFSLNGAIIEVDPSTGVQTVISSDNQFNNPMGIVIDPCGVLILTDSGTQVSDKVFRVNRSDGRAAVLSSGGNFVAPFGVAIVGGGPAPSSARCTLDAALAKCIGETIPPSVLKPLDRALDLIDQAGAAPRKKATRLLRKAKAALKKAARAAGKARQQSTSSTLCAAQIILAANGVRAGLGR